MEQKQHVNFDQEHDQEFNNTLKCTDSLYFGAFTIKENAFK